MKKLFNSRQSMTDDMVDGFMAAFPGRVKRGLHPRVVRRAKDKISGKVRLAIGNGSGHEPIAMGFVGEGLLDANIVGDVFTAPSSDLILEGLRDIDDPAGTILLISRHEGDVINGMEAAFMAEDEGMRVAPFLMYDDISSAPKGQEAERRGAAGTLFVYKILGAAAEAGIDIENLLALARDVRDATRTLGVSLSPGISPLTGKPMFSLPDDEIFIGMGVHGEPGVARRKAGPVNELVDSMIAMLLDDRPIEPGTPTVVLVNGSGGTTLMELFTVYREVARNLDQRGIPPQNPMIGSFSTTQEMGAFSVSLMTPDPHAMSYWRAPQSTPFFPVIVQTEGLVR